MRGVVAQQLVGAEDLAIALCVKGAFRCLYCRLVHGNLGGQVGRRLALKISVRRVQSCAVGV